MLLLSKNKIKLFCIGINKTGTTSIEKALKDLGFAVGDQNKAHALMYDYEKRNFKPIIKYCNTADAFQDAPFSYYYTFIALDNAFPKAKFILTVRDTPEQWYHSLVNFHTKLFGKEGDIPTADDLREAKRPYGRTVLGNLKMRFNINENDVYNKEKLIYYYNTHNNLIFDYFKFKNNLLLINLSNKNSYKDFCDFIEVKPKYDEFPWENKTSNME